MYNVAVIAFSWLVGSIPLAILIGKVIHWQCGDLYAAADNLDEKVTVAPNV